MPDAAPARLPLAQALDEGLAALFRQWLAEPPPHRLVSLADRLEDAWRRRNCAEGRAVG